MSRNAQRLAYSTVSETCPTVDDIFYRLGEALDDKLNLSTEQRMLMIDLLRNSTDEIKEVTSSLRNGIVEAYQELLDAKREFEDEMETLRRQHEKEIASME